MPTTPPTDTGRDDEPGTPYSCADLGHEGDAYTCTEPDAHPAPGPARPDARPASSPPQRVAATMRALWARHGQRYGRARLMLDVDDVLTAAVTDPDPDALAKVLAARDPRPWATMRRETRDVYRAQAADAVAWFTGNG